MGIGAYFSGGKETGTPSSAEINKYGSTPPQVFMEWCLNN
jgi:hypothetical protein